MFKALLVFWSRLSEGERRSWTNVNEITLWTSNHNQPGHKQKQLLWFRPPILTPALQTAVASCIVVISRHWCSYKRCQTILAKHAQLWLTGVHLMTWAICRYWHVDVGWTSCLDLKVKGSTVVQSFWLRVMVQWVWVQLLPQLYAAWVWSGTTWDLQSSRFRAEL